MARRAYEEVETSIMSKNMIINKAIKGSRCAVATMPIVRDPRPESAWRRKAVTRGMRLVEEGWVKKWGPIPWDLAVWNITHVTFEVLVELRIYPE